ncbi:MAG: redoxin domain-containing protein [Prolixibacteraceae bacterium]|jgi:peroxiredoxin|nr:redoxin domain-containing protein [Prolixibacteraceae bacterium]MBT6007516.1 redoxin domain-containing protein [Prolixibacteraceae bacterium]MBT6765884.1 redoxin domain-containing protein [Prolixibacteraceae bacterium]MBT6999616.1 redoxin domain-containing protein [Prolixibacteraceae bacterium]MBT7393263.1 redoxin domain-containing protein [Prolixibacteraceae bacterium]
MKIPAILFSLLVTFNIFAQQEINPQTLAPGSKAIDFKLKGTDEKMYSLASFKNSKILVFIFSAPHCPTAQAYEDRLIAIQNEYKTKDVQLVMINPNSPGAVCLEERGYSDLGDSFEDMQIRAKEKGYNFPFLDDGETEEMSIKYGPVATPHAYVFDEERILRFVGRIDDSEKIGTETQHDLRNALDAIIAGKEVEIKQTKVFGCSIKWKWKGEYKQKLDADWAKKEAPLETLSIEGLKELLKNDSKNLRVINVWATWCGPCVAEFSDLVDTYRMFMGRDFEMYTISTDKLEKREKVKDFLQEKQAALNNNFIFESENKYDLIDNFDKEWPGEIPFTVIIEPGGKIVWRSHGGLDFYEFRKAIVENPLIGRYF